MSDLKPIRVKGELFFPKDLTVPNTMFNEGETRLACTVGNLSEAAVAALEGVGIKVKEKELCGKHIVSKSKFVFEPVDEEGEKIDAKKIGTGTQVIALVTPYAHKMSPKTGMGVRIHKLIVTDLKVYDPAGSVDEESEEAL